MDPRRLLHVTTTDVSLELLLGPQLRAFQESGFEVHTASASGPYVDGLEAQGIRHHELRHSTRSMAPHRDLAAFGELYRLFRTLRPDIVHTHNPKPGVYGRIAGRLARVPLVVNTVHGLYAQDDDKWRRRLPVYALERFAALFSDVELVQNGEDVETLARLRVPRRKLVRLGNGIDLDRFRRPTSTERDAARAELGWAHDDIVIGAVGRLVREKGYAELFVAAARLLAENSQAKVIIIGPDEPSKGDLLTQDDIDVAAAAGVRFLGERADVEHLYWAMDILVHASHREGFPRTPMEAAASGLPVVITDIRGCREIIDEGRGGRFVRPHDPDDLHRVLAEVCAMSHAGRADLAHDAETVRRMFSDTQVIARTLAVYEGQDPEAVVG